MADVETIQTSGIATQEAPARKRGRPTNAELEARKAAAELAGRDSGEHEETYPLDPPSEPGEPGGDEFRDVTPDSFTPDVPDVTPDSPSGDQFPVLPPDAAPPLDSTQARDSGLPPAPPVRPQINTGDPLRGLSTLPPALQEFLSGYLFAVLTGWEYHKLLRTLLEQRGIEACREVAEFVKLYHPKKAGIVRIQLKKVEIVAAAAERNKRKLPHFAGNPMLRESRIAATRDARLENLKK